MRCLSKTVKYLIGEQKLNRLSLFGFSYFYNRSWLRQNVGHISCRVRSDMQETSTISVDVFHVDFSHFQGIKTGRC